MNNNNFSLAHMFVLAAILTGTLRADLKVHDIGEKIDQLIDEARSVKMVYIPCDLLESNNKALKYTQKDGEATIEFIDRDKVLEDRKQEGSRLSGWRDKDGEWVYVVKEYDRKGEEIFRARLKSNEE